MTSDAWRRGAMGYELGITMELITQEKDPSAKGKSQQVSTSLSSSYYEYVVHPTTGVSLFEEKQEDQPTTELDK